MPGNTWAITIQTGVPCASFVPDVFGATGNVLNAEIGDLVCWNNQTSQEHEIWLANAAYEPQRRITDTIAPFQSSQPGYVPQAGDTTPPKTKAGTIYYCCSIHPEERGTIQVVA